MSSAQTTERPKSNDSMVSTEYDTNKMNKSAYTNNHYSKASDLGNSYKIAQKKKDKKTEISSHEKRGKGRFSMKVCSKDEDGKCSIF